MNGHYLVSTVDGMLMRQVQRITRPDFVTQEADEDLLDLLDMIHGRVRDTAEREEE